MPWRRFQKLPQAVEYAPITAAAGLRQSQHTVIYVLILIVVLAFSSWWIRHGHRRWMRATDQANSELIAQIESLDPWRRRRKIMLTVAPIAAIGIAPIGAYVHGVTRDAFIGIGIAALIVIALGVLWEFADLRRQRRS